MEKVHGANFCVIATSSDADAAAVDVKFAKRTAILGGPADAEDFYSCRSAGLLEALAPCAERALGRIAALALPGATGGGSCSTAAHTKFAVHIYGELFGGSYPHPDVPAEPGLLPVQVGVWYSPNLQFMAFDVAVETARDGRSFLDFGRAKELCEGCGFLFAQPLCTGTLSECLEYPFEFETTLPALLGLPSLPPGAGGGEKNLAEGVVVRPCREPAPSAGRSSKDSGRGLFKRKIEAFSEKRYQNDDWKKGKKGGAGQAPPVPAEELALMEVAALVTEQRLANVLSKIGRVEATDREACRQLLQALKDDVAEALEPSDAQVLQGSPQVQQELDALCRALITRELAPRRPRK